MQKAPVLGAFAYAERERFGQELIRRRRSSLLSALLAHSSLLTGPGRSLSNPTFSRHDE